MSQSKIDEQVRLLNAFIEISKRKHEIKPIGTPGSFAYTASKAQIYKTNLVKFKNAIVAKADKIRNDFKEEHEGEGKIINRHIQNAIDNGLATYEQENRN